MQVFGEGRVKETDVNIVHETGITGSEKATSANRKRTAEHAQRCCYLITGFNCHVGYNSIANNVIISSTLTNVLK